MIALLVREKTDIFLIQKLDTLQISKSKGKMKLARGDVKVDITNGESFEYKHNTKLP